MELFDRPGLQAVTGLSARKTNFLLRLLKAPTLEKTYATLQNKEGIDMIEEALQVFKIELNVDKQKLARVLPTEGAFITVSNHPFGFLDGIVLLLIVGRIRPGFKVIANFLLSYFAPIRDLFLTVNPFENAGPKGMGGTRKAIQQLSQNQGLGIFPAGEVSTWYPNQKGIKDREWSMTTMKLIKQANVPVIPIFFAGQNSLSFHLLGKLHPMLRTLRIPAEFLKKKKKTIDIYIGEPILPEQIETMSAAELTTWLKNITYDLPNITEQ
ncbi:MAG: lysophospholipid acyltransferase family protein [Oleibacter sp.]|nr:lysophospholipid acyltransferase family protein [Thalassolituus sp.]